MTVLGVDTSCYRTSLALVGDGAILAQKNPLLPVEPGSRGMMQSRALFEHTQRLGGLMEELFAEAGHVKFDAVCVSARPRPVDGSYMPVFTVGEALARAVAASHGVPLFATSHQQGHLRAALYGTALTATDFLALHLSGGTTELLRAAYRPGMGAPEVSLLGGSEDLHAGQLVDRAGVWMGLPFPAGPSLEALAEHGEARAVIPTANKGYAVNLSGAEAQVRRMLDAGARPEDVAAEIYSLLARAIAKLIAHGASETGLSDVLLAGGVASSARFRRLLPERLARLRCPARLSWAEPALSGDNAVGVALIGEDLLRYEKDGGRVL